MSYVEEILMPQVLAELERLHGDPELIRRCTEIATGVPTAALPFVAEPAPPADDEHVAVGAALFSDPTQLKTAPVEPPAPPLEDRQAWQAAVDDAEARLKAAQDAPHG